MSPAALNLLTAAYENYLKTYETFFSYQFKGADDLVTTINGAQQLYEDGYIENVSKSVYSRTVSIIPFEPIAFELTANGIAYMRSNGKL